MSKYFQLINHKSLGPAVVLEKQNDGVLYVAFSGRNGRKNVLESHPFTEKWDLPIVDFIKYELFEEIFDQFTKDKAQGYIDDEHIQLVDIGDDIINARVKGAKTYEVSISLKNSRICLTCDCPVSGLCKHMYAVCAYIFKRKFYQPRRNDYQAPKNPKKDNPLTSMLSSYFYFEKNSFDFTSFYKIYDHICNNLSDLEQHLEIINQFYSRSQYQLRVMQLLLYPLSLDSKIATELNKINAETQLITIKPLLETLSSFTNTNAYKRLIEIPWYKTAIEYINALFNKDLTFFIERNIRYVFESDYYIINITKYLERYSISLDDVNKLSASTSFRNYMYILRSRIGEEIYSKENVKYLFIYTMSEAELKDNAIPIEVLLKFAYESHAGEKVVSILISRFNEIKVEDYPLISALICDYMFFSLSAKMRYEDDYLALASKLPDNQYLMELVSYQRRKKVR